MSSDQIKRKAEEEHEQGAGKQNAQPVMPPAAPEQTQELSDDDLEKVIGGAARGPVEDSSQAARG